MLILTRRIGEDMVIGDEITVTVLGVKGNQVRLGVVAPKNIAVDRSEIRCKKIANPDGVPHRSTDRRSALSGFRSLITRKEFPIEG